MAAATRSRRRRAEEEDEHPSERWLVTYADMVTLLMVLFIILFAMSTIDENKYQQLKDGLMTTFGHSILGGTQPVDASQGGSAAQADTLLDLTPDEQKQVSEGVQQQQSLQTQRVYSEAKTEVTNLMKVWQQMKRALQKQGLQDDVQATIDQRGLVVSLVSRHIVFEPNLATLTGRGERIVDTLAPVLAQLPQPIEIDGHTNQIKVKPKYFANDWALSAARAITVLVRLQDRDGLPAKRLSESGFGHTKPLVAPSKPGSQDINKRVDIVVLSQASSEAKAHFQEVLQALHATHGGSL